jgi:sorbitol-specific phosphotransferase system component IIA
MNNKISKAGWRWMRLAVVGAVAGVALAMLSGCVFVAVRAVKAVDRAIDPPQALLVGRGTFFGGEVTATARLVPLNAERRERWLKRAKERAGEDGSDAEDGLVPGAAALEKSGARTMLVVTLRNAGTADADVSVVALESVRGSAAGLPTAVRLAPGQRVVLTPLGSEAEEKLERLGVTLGLKRGEAAETQTMELTAR